VFESQEDISWKNSPASRTIGYYCFDLPDSSSMNALQKRYLSYLLRLWRVKQNNENGWRASLESPHTEEVRGFASLELLVEFLREQIGREDAKGIKNDID